MNEILAIVEIIESWQTLLAGCFAIGAALIGGRYIARQTQANHDIEKTRRLASFDAALSTLPLVLSEIVSWIDSVIIQVREPFSKVHGNTVPKSEREIDWHPVPPELIQELRKVIEFCDDQGLRDYLAEILRKMQICIARLNSINPSKDPHLMVSKGDLDDHIYSLVELRLRIETLFSYARRETNTVPSEPDWDRLGTQLSILALDDNQHSRLNERVGTMIKSKKSALEKLSKSSSC